MVAAVATDEPEVAANSAQEPTFECMRPPGSQDSRCASAPYMRSAMPERSRISPISSRPGEVCGALPGAIARARGPGIERGSLSIPESRMNLASSVGMMALQGV